MSERRDRSAQARWRIDELSVRVAEALSVDYQGQSNRQIRDVPNRRTIRYYTTLGLIDRPAAMKGRTAFYSRRHLMQLVAIKRLQLEGSSLAEIQEQLAGATDATLSRVARLSDRPFVTDVEAPSEPEPDTRAERAGGFWQEAPVEVREGREPAEGEPAAVRALLGLSLGPGVTLLLDAERPALPTDVDAIETAVVPLMSLLRSRGLVPARRGEEP